MKRIILFLMVMIFLIPAFQQVGAQVYEFPVALTEQDQLDFLPVSPFVLIVPDKGNFATYFVGDPISLQYETMRAGYISILDYTPDGKVRILKNNEPVAQGIKRSVQGIITEPEGMERFLIILSPRVVPDRILVEGMRNPSRISSILGDNTYLNRSIIQVVTKRREALSVLRFHPIPNMIASGRNIKIRIVLTDESNNPLVNRRVQWRVDQGTLDAYQTYTNTAGESEVWFLAPSVMEITPVTIQAVFDGDTAYGRSENILELTIQPEMIPTVMTLSPKDFQVVGEKGMDFIAELTDKNGKPMARQPLNWNSSLGHWEKRTTQTDENGVSTNRWFAPTSAVKTPVELHVQYKGIPNYSSSEGISTGFVVGLEMVSGKGTYYIDFSSGKPDTNFDESIYRGQIAVGYTMNPSSALVMKSGEYLDVKFQFPPTWETGACYLWGRSTGSAVIQIVLNKNKIFSGSVAEGLVSSLDFQSLHLAQFLKPGENHLRIEVQALDENAVFAVQRVMIVF